MKNLAFSKFGKNEYESNEMFSIDGSKSLTTTEKQSTLGGEVPSATTDLWNDAGYFIAKLLKSL